MLILSLSLFLSARVFGAIAGYHGDAARSGGPIRGMAPFITILAADGWLYVAASGRITAFTWMGQ